MSSGTWLEKDAQRILQLRPAGDGIFESDDGRMQARYDIGTSAIYVGTALKGVAAATAEWTIKKITLDASGNPTNVQWSDERAAVWDDRATETYT